MKTLWPLLCALALLLVTPSRANAHDVRGTAVFFDVGESVVEAELQLPLDQLRKALAAPPPDPSQLSSLPASEEALKAYVLEHFSAEGRDARPFTVEVSSVRRERIDDGDVAVARVRLRPPPGGSARWFTLRSNVIAHRVVSHNLYVFVRRDLWNEALGDEPELLGMMHYQKTSLVVDRSGGSSWRGFQAVFSLGMKHIAEGTDHLLFLLMLLLIAPLVAHGRRWARAGGVRRSLLEILKIVSAFTVGHSLTLIAVVALGAELPSRPVEVAIALSILVSAAHALRPLFAGREALVAAGFGLVHGLGFASVLTGFGFDGAALTIGLLGFNLGIEAMQLAIVALTMPWLVLASRSEHFQRIRVAGAVFGGVAAVGWVVERGLGLRTPVPDLVEALVARAPWGLAALAVTAVALAGLARRHGAVSSESASQT
jgi:HupE / UreJ protein